MASVCTCALCMLYLHICVSCMLPIVTGARCVSAHVSYACSICTCVSCMRPVVAGAPAEPGARLVGLRSPSFPQCWGHRHKQPLQGCVWVLGSELTCLHLLCSPCRAAILFPKYILTFSLDIKYWTLIKNNRNRKILGIKN